MESLRFSAGFMLSYLVPYLIRPSYLAILMESSALFRNSIRFLLTSTDLLRRIIELLRVWRSYLEIWKSMPFLLEVLELLFELLSSSIGSETSGTSSLSITATI